MKLAQDIILKPIITEKSMMGVAENKKYTFKVAKTAGKAEIKAAVEEIFGVKVSKVNVINCKGHMRRYGRFSGYTPSWKKAIVTLTEESKTIDFFDGLM